MQYDPSIVALSQAFNPSSPSSTMGHHDASLVDTAPSSMSTPLLQDAVEMPSSLISPSSEEGTLYTSMDTTSTHSLEELGVHFRAL